MRLIYSAILFFTSDMGCDTIAVVILVCFCIVSCRGFGFKRHICDSQSWVCLVLDSRVHTQYGACGTPSFSMIGSDWIGVVLRQQVV
jgi:hypothetical protein